MTNERPEAARIHNTYAQPDCLQSFQMGARVINLVT